MKEQNLNYSEAFEELQDIVQKMETADISIDELAEKIKRASVLIKICKDKLLKTEEEINTIIYE
jgi:exodeoxyribonuclease VII small subunit